MAQQCPRQRIKGLLGHLKDLPPCGEWEREFQFDRVREAGGRCRGEFARSQPKSPVGIFAQNGLLPQTEQDLAFLDERLGKGSVTVLSRGYGNCRISSTNTRHVWWVQYFNSQDKNILNTLEVGSVPDVACAAPEDIRDSAARLDEILEVYQ